MLIVDEIRFGGILLDALRFFMDQRRFDPWAGTLWHEYCDDYHPTAVTSRVLNHLKMRTVDPALLKPLALWEPGAPHHLHPPETVEDLTCPRQRCSWPAKDYASGRGLHLPRSGPSGESQGRQGIKPIGSF
ncbi:hypothetical protein ACIHFD_37670 [Nonomuraea sp. NPDC051941]|uniref:hypothetical protein n=1 Tax=Nonomuraea sp. NPDC051941 TaxID=3364373 RepID=UPI0037C705BF